MMKLLPWIVILQLISYSAFAGEGNKDPVEKIHKRAAWHLKQSDFLRAAPFLRECVNLKPDNAQYAFELGKSLFEASQYEEALPYLIRAYNLDPSAGKELDFYMARALHYNQSFEEAIDFYHAALNKLQSSDSRYEICQAGIEQCRAAPEILKLQKDFEIKNLGCFVNSRYPEYAATFNGEHNFMIFTTRRPRKIAQMAWGRYLWQDINEEVYEAQLVDTTWMKSKLFVRPIPRFSHDASIALSKDGESLIYYLDKNKGDIFISRKVDGKWGKRESIGENINTKKYNEPSVWISPTGQRLFYVSDKPGGIGKKDLYVSTRQEDGNWGPGENLGSDINTALDEDAPFLSEDEKTLYFSSRGHNSMGGYDVFKCTLMPDGSWGKPENLGIPANSVGDDIYYVEEEGGKTWYLSSDRPGGYGEKDIYMGTAGRKPSDCGPTPLAGTVFDKTTQSPIQADVLLMDPDGKKVITTMQTSQDGKFAITLPAGMETFKLDVNVSSKESASSGASALETGRVNILSGRIVDDVTQEPLGGSVELVDPRSGTVLDEVYTNPKTGNYYVPVESGREYLLRAKSQQYRTLEEEFSVSPKGKIETHQAELGLQPAFNQVNKIVLNWQFFDVNQYAVKDFYSEDLTNLVQVMKKIPELKLRIIGHTDGDGTVEYNQVLSEKRAKSVLAYLVEKGISAERLEASGRGETEPLYPNTNKRLKKWNRRVELYIVN
ncbi:MAG: OmpA family protein [Bacteroidia bacterium]|nr:OmpA family protein [Bacteroidia bacterium]